MQGRLGDRARLNHILDAIIEIENQLYSHSPKGF
jgi:hypothetical protein